MSQNESIHTYLSYSNQTQKRLTHTDRSIDRPNEKKNELRFGISANLYVRSTHNEINIIISEFVESNDPFVDYSGQNTRGMKKM